MFGRKLIKESFELIGVPDFLRSDGPPWDINLLAPYADWGRGGPSTNQKLSSGSGGYSESVHINCNRPARNLPIYHRRVFENMRSSACHTRDNILMEKRT